MAEISAELVKQLRDATNVSMMECKKALVEAGGNMEQATRILRERGMAVAAKKAARATNQGLIASAAGADGRTRSLVEVNCETDFVARNATFGAFVKSLAEKACETDAPLADRMKEALTAKIAEIGENLLIRRNMRYAPQGKGAVASYIHLGGKVGVLVELGCEKDETPASQLFKDLMRDLTLHVAACNPQYLTSNDVPADVLTAEREIYAKQVKNKPQAVIQKIVDGKLQKFYEEMCLLNQGFVREPKQSVAALLTQKGKELGDPPAIRRFARYQLGQ
ncbi:MAG: translation elongation factor Ts [Verrucomicrobiota bacterium]|nr:translation elongation factor Ts [Verrucomicrobiota bacterium]